MGLRNPNYETDYKSNLQVVRPQGEVEQQRAYGAQKRRVLQAFSMTPKTMLMVEVELDIRRTNFTTLLNRMEKQGTIYKVRFSKCPISKRNGVGFYTTNKKYKLKSNQLTLFTV